MVSSVLSQTQSNATNTTVEEVDIDDLFIDGSHDFNLDLKPKITQRTLESALNDLKIGLYRQVYDIAVKVDSDQSSVVFSLTEIHA